MEVVINFEELLAIASTNPVALYWYLFTNGGWIFLIVGFFIMAKYGWLEYIQNKYDSKRTYVMLAVDIPKNNEQSPKALEQFFEHLAGIQTTPKWEDKWLKGKLQDHISLEIVSLGGYIQFLIYSPAGYRDLVEAALYAQYPDAEIIEVEDYAQKYKTLKFPSDEYLVWGAEFKLSRPDHYPMKTHPSFEHPLSQELKDPISSMLEILSKLGPAEQSWFQIVITPATSEWKAKAAIEAKKLTGAKVEPKKNLLEKTYDFPIKLISGLGDAANYVITGSLTEEKKSADAPPSLMQYLSPGEKMTVEAIENKISYTGFYTRIRYVYLTKKDAFDTNKGVDGFLGALNQFNGENSLALNKKKKTKVYGLFKQARLNARRNRIMRLYRLRGRQYRPGYFGYILNSQELATIYHFPVMTVKAPMVKKTESRRAEPPLSLPVEKLPIENITAEENTK